MKKSLILTAKQTREIEQRAYELADEKQLAVAAQLLLQIARENPQDATRWLQVARWQRDARDFSAALETLQSALEIFDRNAPDESSQQATNDTKSAAKTARANSSKADESSISSTRSAEFRALETLWLALSETQAEAQNWNECVAACRSLLHIAPRHHAAREILSTALLHIEQLPEAESVLRELLVLSPRDPLHRLKLATLLQMQGKSGQALREFERVVETYPEAPFAGEAEEAIELLDNLQMQQLLMRAGEQPFFRLQMQTELDETLRENGFHLTDEGRESLRHMMSDGRLAPAPERVRLH